MQASIGTAAITNYVPGRPGVTIAALGTHEAGIGRVGFVLIDLASALAANVVDRKDIDYAAHPKQINETWTSSELRPGTAYRAFVHVYDRTGVNLVAYDSHDFTWDRTEREVGR